MVCKSCGKEKRSKRSHRRGRKERISATVYVETGRHSKTCDTTTRGGTCSESCSASACSDESSFRWKRGCSDISSSGGGDFSQYVNSSYDDCDSSSSSSESCSSGPVRAQFCCCRLRKQTHASVSDTSTTVFREKKHSKKDHRHHHGKSKEYVVTCVFDGTRKVLAIARVGESSIVRPQLKLRLGSTYSFRIECSDFFFTTSSNGRGYPLEGTYTYVQGQVFTFTPTNEHPQLFWYGSSSSEYTGSSVRVTY